jgi:hypothetical protein
MSWVECEALLACVSALCIIVQYDDNRFLACMHKVYRIVGVYTFSY